MGRKPLLWIASIVVALIAGWQLTFAQVDKGRSAQQWEYKALVGDDESSPGEEFLKDVAKLGEDGWELVAVEPSSGYGVGTRPHRNRRVFHFKRPK